MLFEYRGRDVRGEIKKGTIEAENAEAATLRLRQRGITVLKIDQADEEGEGLSLFAKRIRRDEVVYATGQLALMIDTGIPLASALASMIDQEENPSLRRVLADVKQSVEEGSDLSHALARHPKVFDNRYVALVRASEATGKLNEMLERLTVYLRKEVEMRSKVRAAMAYPCIMATLAVGVSIFLLGFVMPKFTPLFNRRGMKLPMPTVVMLAISDALTNYWYLWLVAAAAGIAGLYASYRTERGRRIIDRIRINIPVLGPLTRKIIVSRSIRALGAMLSGGVQILDALKLCTELSTNWHYRRMWIDAAEAITNGAQLSKALAGTPLLPPTLVQMISSGEDAGKLPMVLERVSDYYDQEVENSVKSATSILEPLLISVMGVVVGGIGLALLLPIFKLSQPA